LPTPDDEATANKEAAERKWIKNRKLLQKTLPAMQMIQAMT
jgi:hypothetical protein